MAGSGSGVCLENFYCQNVLFQQSSSAEVELWSGGVSPGMDWDSWSPFMVSSTPMPTALFFMTMCLLRCGSLRVGPLLLSGRQCQLSCFDVNQGLVWCQWSSSNGLACPEPRPEPYWEPLRRVASPNSGVHYPSKIGEGTYMSSPSRVEENTASCHTSMPLVEALPTIDFE